MKSKITNTIQNIISGKNFLEHLILLQMPTIIEVAISSTLAYFLGAIPFGIIVAKACGVDILSKGSGNSGATNVLRSIGPIPGAIVFLADMFKGLLSCLLASTISQGDPAIIALAALLAILGHNYSIFLKGKGGKGAATGVGVLFYISWPLTLLLLFLATAIIALTRYVSVASLVNATVAPVAFYLTGQPLPYVLLAILVCIFIWIKHIPNVKRLIAGNENKLGRKPSA